MAHEVHLSMRNDPDYGTEGKNRYEFACSGCGTHGIASSKNRKWCEKCNPALIPASLRLRRRVVAHGRPMADRLVGKREIHEANIKNVCSVCGGGFVNSWGWYSVHGNLCEECNTRINAVMKGNITQEQADQQLAERIAELGTL